MTTSPVLTDLIADADRQVSSTEEDLISVATGLILDLERTIADLRNGLHVNDRGVVQSRGADVDRLCALRQERVAAARRLHYLAEKMADEA